jgi:hypothetical protein
MPLGGGITLGTIALISSIIGAGAGTTAAIKNTKNNQLRREFESNLALLNQSQKNRLEKSIQEAKSIEEKRKVLEETLANVTKTRVEAIEQQKAESQKQLNKLVLIGGVAVAILIVGLVIVYAKRK